MAPVQLIIAIGGQQENPTPAAQPASDVLEKLARRWVGPVEILQQEEQPGPFGGQAEEGQDRLVEPYLGLGRFTRVDQGRLQLELRQNRTERAIHQRSSYGAWAGRRTLDRHPLSSRWRPGDPQGSGARDPGCSAGAVCAAAGDGHW